MKNEKKLNKILTELLELCKKEGTVALFNQPIKNKLISFQIKDKKEFCKTCGRELE
jgi:hypothetical protein